MTGECPAMMTTRVVKCVTVLGGRLGEGVESLEYRRVAFQRFVAFRGLAKKYWQTFLV
jgi:hypothetical protein